MFQLLHDYDDLVLVKETFLQDGLQNQMKGIRYVTSYYLHSFEWCLAINFLQT